MSTVSNGPLFRSRATVTQERKEPVHASPAHTRGGSELNTYPQACEENVSRRSDFAHDLVSTVANWCRSEGRTVEAELGEERSWCGAQCSLGAVLDLEGKREAVRRGRAEKRFGSTFGDPA